MLAYGGISMVDGRSQIFTSGCDSKNAAAAGDELVVH